MGLAFGAVVELILAELLLTGEGLKTAVQADGLGLGSAGLLHAAVLLHNLRAGRQETTASFRESRTRSASANTEKSPKAFHI